jgi:hypothetical protein
MVGPGVKLGSIASKLFSPPWWTDYYPSSQAWADELELLLQFADSDRQIGNFLPRLNTPRRNQRDEALNELRIAYFLHGSGFPVVAWEPPGQGGKVGECSIRAPEGSTVFTEVKSPGWESELAQAERLAGRTKLPKYIDGDGGPYANWKGMRDCIRRAYGKFTPNEPNLLVIADDFFVNLTVAQLPIDVALYDSHTGYGGEAGYFTSAAYQNIGGVAVFAATAERASIGYRFQVFENRFASLQAKLPSSLLRLRG